MRVSARVTTPTPSASSESPSSADGEQFATRHADAATGQDEDQRQDGAGEQEARAGGEERRQRPHGDLDRDVGRAPHEVDRPEGGEELPAGGGGHPARRNGGGPCGIPPALDQPLGEDGAVPTKPDFFILYRFPHGLATRRRLMSITDRLLRNTERSTTISIAASCHCRRKAGGCWPAWMRASTPTGSSGWRGRRARDLHRSGGIITDDEIRSIAISQRLLRTRGDSPHPPHGLRHAHVRRRRLPAPARRPGSSPGGPRGVRRPGAGRPPVDRPDQDEPLHPAEGFRSPASSTT